MRRKLFDDECKEYEVEEVDKYKWLEDRIGRGIKTYCNLHHDESTLHKYKHFGCSWSSDKVKGLYPKSQVQGINISDIIFAWNDPLRDGNGNYAPVMHKIGSDAARGQYY